MKILFKLIFCFMFSVSLTGCYAFLKAERLVYAGTLAKSPNGISVNVDTLVTNVEVPN